ncbi:MAG: hypothetical protein ACYSW8_31425 [Planctomycetota bacterium]
MSQPKWVCRVMDLLIERVRYEGATQSLDPEDPCSDDTQAIRDATELYTRTWIIPLLEAVRDGDRATAEMMTR